jgi:hypothetical protein
VYPLLSAARFDADCGADVCLCRGLAGAILEAEVGRDGDGHQVPRMMMTTRSLDQREALAFLRRTEGC